MTYPVERIERTERQQPGGPDPDRERFADELRHAGAQPRAEQPPEPTPGPVSPDPSPGPTAGPPGPQAPELRPGPGPLPPTPAPTGTAPPQPTPDPPVAPPNPPPGAPAPQGGPGFLRQAIDLLTPDSYSYGLILGKKMPVQGVALVSAPWGNGPFDFTRLDKDPGNSLTVNLRRTPSSQIPGWPVPSGVGPGSTSIVGSVELEAANLLGGGSPVNRVELGWGGLQRVENPILPFTVIANGRIGEDLAANQTVLSGNVSVNLGAHTVLSRGLAGAAGIAALVPGGQPVAAGLARGAAAVEKYGGMAADYVMVGGGVGYRFEARINNGNPFQGVPPSFDGLYRKGQRIDLPDFVEGAIDQELVAPRIPGEENMAASLTTRIVENGVAEATEALGLPPVSTWDDAVPSEVKDALATTGRVLRESWDEAGSGVLGAFPVPGMGLPLSLAKNAAEEAWQRATGNEPPGWMQSLLDPWHLARRP